MGQVRSIFCRCSPEDPGKSALGCSGKSPSDLELTCPLKATAPLVAEVMPTKPPAKRKGEETKEETGSQSASQLHEIDNGFPNEHGAKVEDQDAVRGRQNTSSPARSAVFFSPPLPTQHISIKRNVTQHSASQHNTNTTQHSGTRRNATLHTVSASIQKRSAPKATGATQLALRSQGAARFI